MGASQVKPRAPKTGVAATCSGLVFGSVPVLIPAPPAPRDALDYRPKQSVS